jgi:formate dehydrogenase iron-sulfur subunit
MIAPAMTTLYIPSDSAALALGADEVARLLYAHAERCGLSRHIVRTSTRAMLWLEPLVEIETSAGRVGYGPVSPEDLDDPLMDAILQGKPHERCIGVVDHHPYLIAQQRWVFERLGHTQPLSLADYEQHGGWAGLRAAFSMGPQATVQAVLDSGLRGRGGAAFPAAIKWHTVAQAPGEIKYVVCNADEGDSGAFADRLLMENDPFELIEGMLIAGYATGANAGMVYIRSEYPRAITVMRQAIELAQAAAWVGSNIQARQWSFTLEVRVGAGSYVCGEETAMLESIEGRRGVVRAKPPLPAIEGLFGRPTVINNVLTLASVPRILALGSAAYAAQGRGRSTGTQPFQLAGNVRQGGLVEVPFGISLRRLLIDFGAGTASGRPIKAVQVGGPLGSYVPEQQWDEPLDYETYTGLGAVLGHGSIVVHDDSANLAQLARFAMAFCAFESCGKCTPCRIGSTRGVETIHRLVNSPAANKAQSLSLLKDLCDTMQHGSLCAMGGMTPYPVRSALLIAPEDFGLEAQHVES